jgi:TonB family protein
MQMQQSYRKHFIISIVLHVFIFLILAVGFQFTGQTFVIENSNVPNIINAMVMTSPAASMKVAPPKPVPPPPIQEPVKQLQKPLPVEKIIPPKKDVIALDDKKLKQKQHEMLEKQLLADLNKAKVKQKSIKQKALEEAFESEIKNLKAKSKQQTQQQSDRRINAEREQKARGIVDKYKALVLQQVGRRWIIPSNVDRTLATKIVIFLAPGGRVLNAEIYESSGNAALDNSARAAVFKASPLPVPSDAEGFEFFKRFVLVFKPMYFQNGEYNPNATENL